MEKQAHWPAWYYGPNGTGQIFDRAEDVPAGWQDHPSKVGKAAQSAATPTLVTPDTETVEIDADGHPWSADIHAASKSKTKAGLWRMKVGASRPAPMPGFPRSTDADTGAPPPLDL